MWSTGTAVCSNPAQLMYFQPPRAASTALQILSDDDAEARMFPISHRPTEDFESEGTAVASVDVPIDNTNVGYGNRRGQ